VTLRHAFGRVKKGKGGLQEVRSFAANLDGNINRIAQQLRDGTFRFGGYTYFNVYEPKERLIAAAPIRERVVHHAIIAVCGARLENSIVPHSFACRKGMGQWTAVARAHHLAGRHPWALKIDIKSYFDSIDHEILLDMIGRKIKDVRLLSLMRDLVESYTSAKFGHGRGVPIGNLTSQYFANLYLDPLDRMPGPPRVRYMDDTLFFRYSGRAARIRSNHPRVSFGTPCALAEPQIQRTVPYGGRRELPGVPTFSGQGRAVAREQAAVPRQAAPIWARVPARRDDGGGLPEPRDGALRLPPQHRFRDLPRGASATRCYSDFLTSNRVRS